MGETTPNLIITDPYHHPYLAAIVEAAADRKGDDIVVLQVTEVSFLADYFVLVTGFSRVQVRAIALAIRDQVAEKCQRLPRHLEGERDSTWVLLDYGDVIVHVFMPEQRQFYNLEAFWGHARRLPGDLAG